MQLVVSGALYDIECPSVNNGLFVVYEGIDGCGKSSVATAVHNIMVLKDFKSAYKAEPTNLYYGEKLRRASTSKRLGVNTEIQYFAEDRREDRDIILLPLLNAGYTVHLDRYVYSSIAYQGTTEGVSIKKVVEANAHVLLEPSICFIFDINPKTALERVTRNRSSATAYEKLTTLCRAQEIYDSFAASNIYHIDATKPLATIIEEVLLQILNLHCNLQYEKN